MDTFVDILGPAMPAIVGALVGGLAALGGTWLTLRHDRLRWHLDRRDETYQLLGEWLSEEWEWAREIDSNGIELSDQSESHHERHCRVEVMVMIHGSKKVDSLISEYSAAASALRNTANSLGRQGAFAADPSVDRVGELRSALVLFQRTADKIWDQMRVELN